MHPKDKQPQAQADLEVRLEEALRGATVRTDGDVPEHVDKRVLAIIDAKVGQMSRRQAGSPVPHHPAWRWAAALLVCSGLGLVVLRRPHGASHGEAVVAAPPAARPVDIVDAYLLASQLQAGVKLDSRWDRNGDERGDARDVEALAKQAVALSPDRG